MYIIGKTGMGKSVLIENMVYSDIMEGNGVCLVDPHGDSAELLVDSIPEHRLDDVIYFNPSDMEFPIAFNVLEKVEPRYRHLVASGLVGVFKKIWADSWGPRLEYLLRNTILALLDFPDSTLLGVNRMLVDNEYRKKVIAKVQDPVVKAFWVDEFSKYNQQFLTEAIAPIQNKVGQFLSTSLIRNIVGQVKSSIDLRKIMDEKKILILNMSKGRIGEDASSLLGAMVITKIQLAAMSRVDVPESERADFYLYVDEFQNFATESFANILSEARKYHLCLTIGHQYIGQLEIGGNYVVRNAIFGNVGTIVVFRVGAADAEFLTPEFTPRFEEEDLVNLPKYQVYLKLMIDGVASDPFSAYTLPPIQIETKSTEKVTKATREQYTQPVDVVEDTIIRWSGVETEAMIEKLEKELLAKQFAKVFARKPEFLAKFEGREEPEDEEEKKLEETTAKKVVEDEEPKEKKDEVLNIVKCDDCGQKTKINFNPDPKKPVFCKECLKVHRRDEALKENARKAGGGGDRRPPQKNKYSRNDSNSRPPRRDYSAQKSAPRSAPASSISNKEVSLKDALSKGAVDFKGNVMKQKQE
jgi:CxxC-x17-CxxC domain-containing protein